MGYSQDYHMERYLREAMVTRTAPITSQLILSHLAERVLDLPKSYRPPPTGACGAVALPPPKAAASPFIQAGWRQSYPHSAMLLLDACPKQAIWSALGGLLCGPSSRQDNNRGEGPRRWTTIQN